MKVTLVLDEADADRLATLADLGRVRALATGANKGGDRELVERIRTARRHTHRSKQ